MYLFSSFFYTGCGGPSAEEKLKMEEQRLADSIAISSRSVDSIATIGETTLPDSFCDDSSNESNTEIDTTNDTTPFIAEQDTTKNDKEKSISQQIVEAYPIFKIFLNPKPNIYTGIGTTINVFPYFYMFGTFLSLLFL